MRILEQIDAAVEYLKEHGATRDPDTGLWMKDGLALAGVPIEAAKQLRAHFIRQAVEKNRQAGRHFTR
jgi:hypothetical protein